MVPMPATVVIRSRPGRVGCLFVSVAGAGLLVMDAMTATLSSAVRALPWVALVVLVSWLMWGLARIVVDEDELLLDNPLVATGIGWGAVEVVTQHWGVVVRAAGRDHTAWVAAGGPGLGQVWASRRRGTATGWMLDQQPPACGTLDLGARECALLLEDQRLRRQGSGHQRVERRVHRERLALLLLLVVLCGLTLL